MSGAFEIGKLFGIRVKLHYSWILIFLLVAWSLATTLPTSYPGWSQTTYWLIGLLGSLFLFLSVLIHEFSHSLVAISRGYKVTSITLFLLGGVSEIESEANNPSEEFLIAIVGPLSSILLAAIFYVVYLFTKHGNAQVAALTQYLFLLNLTLGIFNLVPGYPMDGGRVLRSIAWKATGSLRRGTTIAANTGIAVGFCFIAVGIFVAFSSDVLGGLWIALIGWFIESSAGGSKNQQTLHTALTGRKVRDAMSRDFPAITPGTSLQQLVDDHIAKEFNRAYLVVLGDQFYGLVTAADIRSTPEEARANTPVTAVMTRADKVQTVSPDDPLELALQKLAVSRIHQLVVVEGGHPVGLITREHVLSILELTDLFTTRETPVARGS